MLPFQIGFFQLLICISASSMSFYGSILVCLFGSFVFSVEKYSIFWIYHDLFIHLHTEGNVSCFQVLSIITKAVINIHVRFCVDMSFQSLWVNTKYVIAGLYCESLLSFVRNGQSIFQRGCSCPTSSEWESLGLHILVHIWCFKSVLHFGHSKLYM